MKRLGAVLALMCMIASAHAVQEVTLKDVPPLQPLHSCKHSDGSVVQQGEPCGSDSTEVSSIVERRPDGNTLNQPLEKPAAPGPASRADQPAANDAAAKSEMSEEDKKRIMREGRMHLFKFIGFALVFGIVAKLLKRSFFLWFILGFVLRMVLVAVNVMAF